MILLISGHWKVEISCLIAKVKSIKLNNSYLITTRRHLDLFIVRLMSWPLAILIMRPFDIGHKDSVTCVGFSSNSKYFATADMSGIIKVWELETKQEIFAAECTDIEVY